jgi:hypothetical protein
MDRDHRPGSGINDAALGSANRPIQFLGDLLDQCGLTRLPRPGDHLNESTRLREAPSQFSGLAALVILRFTQCVEYFYSEHEPMQDHPLLEVLPAWLDLPMNNAVDPVSGLRPMGSGPAIPVHPETLRACLRQPGLNRQHVNRHVRRFSQRFSWEERDGVADSFARRGESEARADGRPVVETRIERTMKLLRKKTQPARPI